MNEPNPSRPPEGIEPEYIWKEKRLRDLILAAGRSINASRPVNFVWYVEMRKLIDYLEDRNRRTQ